MVKFYNSLPLEVTLRPCNYSVHVGRRDCIYPRDEEVVDLYIYHIMFTVHTCKQGLYMFICISTISSSYVCMYIVYNLSKTALESPETMISEADHNLAASLWLEPNLDVEASLQSAKYFPVTFATLGCVAT